MTHVHVEAERNLKPAVENKRELMLSFILSFLCSLLNIRLIIRVCFMKQLQHGIYGLLCISMGGEFNLLSGGYI